MRVLLITGSFPPVKCGVGHYSYQLVNAMSAIPNIEIRVLTSSTHASDLELPNVSLIKNNFGWRIRDVLKLRKMIAKFNPDIVHIQYPTTEYSGLLAKYLPILLRFMGLHVVQTWHEHYSECRAIGWPNVLACDALIYVRPDFLDRLPNWVKKWLRNASLSFIPNASTIPVVTLSNEQSYSIKHNLSGGKAIVCFFGFANPNKGIEHLFEIADPANHHLVLMCDLSDKTPYQKKILALIKQDNWRGSVTVTGFQPEQRIGEILAVADAVIFPFPQGAGDWNTSLKAAESAGVFSMATTKNSNQLGYQQDRNIYFFECGKIDGMRQILNQYLGVRAQPCVLNEWKIIAQKHYEVYQLLVKNQ